ncbi:arginase family protein [Paractinoplanes deccanensis]|nr:arginase family protein [Actinoplanes deccanensis]
MTGSDWFLLGAPWDSSGLRRGEERAPTALRRAGIGRLAAVDRGDAATVISSSRRDEATGVRALADTVAAARELAGVLWRREKGRRPLVVGGDCSLLLGVFAGARAALGDVGLWMADGHPDFLDPPSSETGETADSQLAVLTGDGPAELVGLGGAAPMVAAEHVALLGHRTAGLDAASAAELARVPDGLFAVDALAVAGDPHGAGRRAAAWGEELGLPMWLHLDVDVLDPAVLPAVTYPQPGGPDLDQLAAMLTPLAASPRLAGVSIADFRPDLDPGGEHAARLVTLLERIL